MSEDDRVAEKLAEVEVTELLAQLAEADRRAGAAERRLADAQEIRDATPDKEKEDVP